MTTFPDTVAASGTTVLDVGRIRADFPILSGPSGRKAVGVPGFRCHLAAARQVLDAERTFLTTCNAAVHRGAHQLAEEATDAYEGCPETIARFVGASADGSCSPERHQIAQPGHLHLGDDRSASVFGGKPLGPGDTVVITELEHHANLVPWQNSADVPAPRCAGSGSRRGRIDLDSLGSTTPSKVWRSPISQM